MKKTAFILILMIMTAASGFALDNIAIQVFGESSINATGMDFNDEDGDFSFKDFELKGISPIYWGLTTKLIFDKIGFGWTAQGNWKEENNDMLVNFDFSLYLSYHFFKLERPIDFFVETGIGTMGKVNIDKACDYNYESDYNKYLALSIYPHLATGIAFKPGIFTIGARLTWRPIAGKIPGLDFQETSMLEFGLFIGCTFNIKIDHDENRNGIDDSEEEDYDDDDYDYEDDDDDEQEELQADYDRAREEAEDFLMQMEEETRPEKNKKSNAETVETDNVKVKVEENNNNNSNSGTDVNINININN